MERKDGPNDTNADQHAEWYHRHLPLIYLLGMLAVLLFAIVMSSLNTK